jgi:hypothetical protein
MTRDEMYQGTKGPVQNDRGQNERGRSVMPPNYPIDPDQTFALVLVPALTKMGEKFCVFLPSAVAPLSHPQNSQNEARAEGDKIKS